MNLRLIPHCSRRTSANFWRVQELGEAGWTDWPGLHSTKGSALRAIDAARAGDSPLRPASATALRGLDSGPASDDRRDCEPTLRGARSLLAAGPVGNATGFGAGNSQAVTAVRGQAAASTAPTPSAPATVFYRYLDPGELLIAERRLLAELIIQARFARLQLLTAEGWRIHPFPAFPRISLMCETTRDLADVESTDRVGGYWHAEHGIGIVTGSGLPETTHLLWHEASHAHDWARLTSGSRYDREVAAEQFARKYCRGCAVCRHSLVDLARASAGGVTNPLARRTQR